MPRVPEPLPAPQSLGGLLKHMVEDESIASLTERTLDTNEDIEERAKLVESIASLDEEETQSSIETVE
jgi:hypothetical protein